jgi:Family of unknown function (DUF5924)/Protein of unknown function (DUF2914)
VFPPIARSGTRRPVPGIRPACPSVLSPLPSADVQPSGLRAGIGRLTRLAARHQSLLWWGHSAWALAWGIVAMWLGTRHFAFLRIAVLYVAAVWLLSLTTPPTDRPLPDRRAHWIRTGIAYLSRNFYQQILFFVLPIYYASATAGTINMAFVVLLALSALLSTLDVVYDRHLSRNRDLAAVFFTLNLFACLTAALPILWHVGPSLAVRTGAGLAFLGFVSFHLGRRPGRLGPWGALIASALLLAWIAGPGQRIVPPVPLRLVHTDFGDQVNRESMEMATHFTTLPAGWTGTLDAVTSVRAPMGLSEAVRHRWTVNGVPVKTTPAYQVSGGRPGGFRIWTALPIDGGRPGAWITLDVETEGGQIIGRGTLRIDAR